MDGGKNPDLTTKILVVGGSLALLAAAVMLAMLATTAFVHDRVEAGAGYAAFCVVVFVASEVLRRRL